MDLYEKIKNQLDTYVYDDYKKLKQECDEYNYKIVVFGAGKYGEYMLQQLKQNNMEKFILGFCDNSETKWGRNIEGFIIKSFDEWLEEKNQIIFLIGSLWNDEIEKQLESRKQKFFKRSRETVLMEKIDVRKDLIIKECPCGSIPYYLENGLELYSKEETIDKIKNVREMLFDDISKEIFDLRVEFVKETNMLNLGKMYDISKLNTEVLPLNKSEVFVDCGAYIGDSIDDFLKVANGKYKKIYAFEPDYKNYKIMCKYIKDNKIEAETFMAGVGEENARMNFSSNGNGGACFSDSGEDVLEIMCLDDVFMNSSVSYIKMDIEGSELKALKGAKNTIIRDTPKLHISIYHKPEDLYEIPLFIKNLVPEYKFAIRHRTELPFDTDLYAWV